MATNDDIIDLMREVYALKEKNEHLSQKLSDVHSMVVRACLDGNCDKTINEIRRLLDEKHVSPVPDQFNAWIVDTDDHLPDDFEPPV